MKINVYEIEGYTIAAKCTDHAFSQFMEETNGMDGIFIGDLEEGETEEVTIEIRRLTQKQIDAKRINCCVTEQDDGCEFCRDKEDKQIVSCSELMSKFNESDFPCVVAREE